MIKAIVFDFDGVIADSLDVGFNVTNKILETFGKQTVSREKFREEFSADWERFYRSKGMTEEMIKKEPKLFKREYDMVKNEIKIFEGINLVIDELTKKYKLGIVSNNYWESIVEFLQKFKIHGHFDSIVGYTPGALKPDVKPLMICLNELGVKPEEVYLIGDMEDEITMARRANVAKVIAVSYGYHPLHKLGSADVVVHTPAEILDAIRKFEGV